jgi:hypothetical protein
LRFASKLLRHRSIVAVLSDFARMAGKTRSPGSRAIATSWRSRSTTRASARFGCWMGGFFGCRKRQRVLVDTSHAATRGRLQVAAERLAQERGRKLAQAGVDRVALRTDVPYGVPLRRAFAARARRLAR